jgi:CRP-like cAMP-binding protein
MAKATSSRPPSGNRLLARLPPDEYKRLHSRLKPVLLEPDQLLHKARTPFQYAYFPTRSVGSYLRIMESGSTIEVGTVGNEGMIGVSGALGAPESPHQVIAQVAGEALRIEVKALLEEVDRSAMFRRLLVTYQAAFHSQVSQSVACNGLHPINKRCCRWLLMTHDRVGAEVLPLTHEYLGFMLGVRRASITEVLGGLQGRGLIHYSRGSITVLNRKGLEAASCECYKVVNDEYDRLCG